jgi:hypothetical protein
MHVIASMAMFIVLGSLLEGIPAVVLFGPLLFPIAEAVGVHPVHYAMIAVLSMEMGLFAPPFGVGYYTACAINQINPEEGMRPIMAYMLALGAWRLARDWCWSREFRGYRRDFCERVTNQCADNDLPVLEPDMLAWRASIRHRDKGSDTQTWRATSSVKRAADVRTSDGVRLRGRSTPGFLRSVGAKNPVKCSQDDITAIRKGADAPAERVQRNSTHGRRFEEVFLAI